MLGWLTALQQLIEQDPAAQPSIPAALEPFRVPLRDPQGPLLGGPPGWGGWDAILGNTQATLPAGPMVRGYELLQELAERPGWHRGWPMDQPYQVPAMPLPLYERPWHPSRF
jgi:hypothetical protein